MGGFISKFREVAFGECELFLSDFPINLHKFTLPWLIIDNLGVFCVGGKNNRIINAITHGGFIIGLLAANKTKFLQSIGKFLKPFMAMLYKGITDNQAAFIGPYLITQIILIIASFLFPSPAKDESIEEKCKGIVNPIKLTECMGQIIKDTKSRKSHALVCKETQVYDAGLCYPKLSENIEKTIIHRGPYAWPKCPKGFRNDGAYCFKENSYDRGVGVPLKGVCPKDRDHWGGLCYKACPKGSKRTASCTCDFGKYGRVYTNARAGIGKLKLGQECTPNNGVDFRKIGNNRQIYKDAGKGWHKSAAWSCQKGGIVTSCGLYGDGKTPNYICDKDHPIKSAGLCYKKPKDGFKCTVTHCSRICPDQYVNVRGNNISSNNNKFVKEKMKDIGISCEKKSIHLGVGKPISACKINQEKIGALCYDDCSVFDTPTKKYKNQGILCVKE